MNGPGEMNNDERETLRNQGDLCLSISGDLNGIHKATVHLNTEQAKTLLAKAQERLTQLAGGIGILMERIERRELNHE